MAFGKRTGMTHSPAAASAPSAGNPHGQRKVFSEEIFAGKHGDFLRELGFGPDDPGNLVPNAGSVNAKIELDRAAFEERLARYNLEIGRRTNGGMVRGFSLLPDPCWNGETGHLLMMRLELFPYDDWNMALLPADLETAQALNAPPHPGRNIPAFVERAAKFMASIDAGLRHAVAETERTGDYAKFGAAREEMRNKIKNFASQLYATMAERWEQNRPRPN
jgi:hypothetical protein